MGPPRPVPHTRVKSRGDRTLARSSDPDDVVLTPDALRYYDKLYEERRKLRDEVLADEGECDFELGHALRLTWVSQQRADPVLMEILVTLPMPTGFRIAPDGLLERLVPLPAPAGDAWIPVVPDGTATGNLTWKRWLFLQFHAGILGGAPQCY